MNTKTILRQTDRITKIEYFIKNVYGVDRRYIVDAKIALHIRALTNEKTLSMEQMESLTQLGFEFERVLSPEK